MKPNMKPARLEERDPIGILQAWNMLEQNSQDDLQQISTQDTLALLLLMSKNARDGDHQ